MTEARTDALLEILLGLLAPLLMSGAATDTGLARRAAEQAIAEYRARTLGDLVTISQIVAFALTALDNLRLSMSTDLSLSMKLKLRGNANTLSRASLHATRALGNGRQADDPAIDDWIDTPEPVPVEPPAQEPVPVTLPVAEQNRRHWANAMATVGAELKARAAEVPPAQRRSDQLWVKVLANVASELRQPNSPPNRPGLSKADLFRTTLMTGSGGFPAHLLAETAARRAGR